MELDVCTENMSCGRSTCEVRLMASFSGFVKVPRLQPTETETGGPPA